MSIRIGVIVIPSRIYNAIVIILYYTCYLIYVLWRWGFSELCSTECSFVLIFIVSGIEDTTGIYFCDIAYIFINTVFIVAV